MPLTDFTGGEDWLLSAARHGKQDKKSAYDELAKIRSKERQQYIDLYAPAVKELNARISRPGIRGVPDPKKKSRQVTSTSVVDAILGNNDKVSTSTLNEIDSIALGQKRDVVGLLQTADLMGIPAIAQIIENMTQTSKGLKQKRNIPEGYLYEPINATLRGVPNPNRVEAIRNRDDQADRRGIISAILDRVSPETKEKYAWVPGVRMPIFDPEGEYGRGLGEYTTTPTANTALELGLMAAPLKVPGAGKIGGMALRKGISTLDKGAGALKAASSAGIKPSTKLATAGGIGGIIAATQLAQPEEAEALSGKNFVSFVNKGNTTLKRSLADSVNSRARKIFRKAGMSADEAIKAGFYTPVSNETLREKGAKALSANENYAMRLSQSGNIRDWVVLHSPGASLGRGGTHGPTTIEWGSNRLNILDENMQRAGSFAKNWKEVIEWGIKNDPSLSGKSLEQAAEQLGALHLI